MRTLDMPKNSRFFGLQVKLLTMTFVDVAGIFIEYIPDLRVTGRGCL